MATDELGTNDELKATSLSAASVVGLSSGGPLTIPIVQTAAWTIAISALAATLAIYRYRNLASR